MSAPVPPPSGEQHEITHGGHRAVVVEVGGGVREYVVDGREVLQRFPVDAVCDGAHGMPLIPWPNRLADGRYSFDGSDYQVPLDEPEKHNAIHGFLRWRAWEVVERRPDAVVMGIRLHPMPGYPFDLEVRVRYAVADDGLTVTTTLTNVGAHAAPVGIGQHPYLSPGEGTLDACRLQLDAGRRVLTDDRQLPTGLQDVAGTRYDFRSPAPIGDLEIDDAFDELVRDDDGRAWARLTGPDGRTAQLWVDGSYALLEVFTGDTLAPDRARTGLGIEPMTCPPNALASGDRVIRLEPGATTRATWGAQLA